MAARTTLSVELLSGSCHQGWCLLRLSEIRLSVHTQFIPKHKKARVARITFVGLFRRLVDDCAVLEAPQIKHTHTAVGATANKDVHAVRTEAYVEHLLVVGDELSLRCQRGDVPDRAGRIDT